jgi:hypothetical protein
MFAESMVTNTAPKQRLSDRKLVHHAICMGKCSKTTFDLEFFEWKLCDSKQPVDMTGPKFAVFVLNQYQEGITEKGCMFAEPMVTNTAPKQRQTDSQFLHKEKPIYSHHC